jgi:aminoglycoside 6'-N-acetyltransferase I
MRSDLWPEAPAAEHASEIEAFFAGMLREPLAVLMATGDANEPAGFAELSIRPYAEGCETDRVAYLEGWYVVPGARRTGVGRALIDAAEAWARSRGCSEFASDAVIDNEVSAAAHRALGFEEVERIRCYRKTLKDVRSAPPAQAAVEQIGTITIRDATLGDAVALAELVTELGYPTTTEQMVTRLEAILSKPDYLTLVAVMNEQITGFIGAQVRPSYESDGLYGHILAFVVSRDARRRGVGRALIGTLESLLARRGITVVIVNTGNHRADAHAFYDRAGYSFTGRRYRKILPDRPGENRRHGCSHTR